MRAVIRTDASLLIGTGHVMRCLTLADFLREKDVQVEFVSTVYPGHMIDFIKSKGFRVLVLEDTQKSQESCPALLKDSRRIDWFIVDHYGLDAAWEKSIRPLAAKIMVIDDVADRTHDCDLLLDQNSAEPQRYAHRVPDFCRMLLGPRYALIRKEFLAAAKQRRSRTGKIDRLLLFMGGSDLPNETAKALRAIQLLDHPTFELDVIVGATNPHVSEIQTLCEKLPKSHVHIQTDAMAEFMSRADLAIGAAGTASWERCLMSLPSIIWILAENQDVSAKELEGRGAALNLGSAADVKAERIADVLRDLMSKPDRVQEMGRKSREIMGGDGFLGVEGVVETMLNFGYANA